MCCDRHELHFHRNHQHGGANLQTWPQENIWSNNKELREIMEGNRLTILRDHTRGDIKSVYNFPSNGLNHEEIINHLKSIYHDMNGQSYKINMMFGMVLKHVETEKYRFYAPYRNVYLLPSTFYVKNHQSLIKLMDTIQKMDLENMIEKLNIKWKLFKITNVTYDVINTELPMN